MHRVKLSRRQLRSIIREALLNEQDEIEASIATFITDDIFVDEDELNIDDVIEQSVGSGYEKDKTQEVIDRLLDDGVLKDDSGTLSLA